MIIKLRKVTIFIFLLGLIISSHAQKVKGVIIAGLNVSQISGDESVGFNRWGFNVGAGAMVSLDKREKWTWSLETLITQKGAHENDNLMKYDAYLTYAEIPILIHFQDRKGKFAAGTGLSYGRLIK